MKTGYLVVNLILLALILGLLPPGYATLFSLAHTNAQISDGAYGCLSLGIRVLTWPGDLLLSITPWEGALKSTHFPFLQGLAAATIGNSVAWACLLALTWWAVFSIRRSVRTRRR